MMENLLNMTKKEVEDAGEISAINLVEEGRENIIDAYLNAKANIDYLSMYISRLHKYALEEFERYGEKEVERFGAKVSSFETGVSYSYSNCGHPEYKLLEDKKKNATKELSDLEKTLKTITKPISMFNKDTGEVFEVKPPAITSTTKLKVIY